MFYFIVVAALLFFSTENSKAAGHSPLSKEYDYPVELRLKKQFLENNKINVINVEIMHLHYSDAEFVDHERTFHTIKIEEIFNQITRENLEEYTVVFAPKYPFNAMTLDIVLGGYLWMNRIEGGSKMTEDTQEGIFISEKRPQFEF